jgi:hypothetical protein
MTQKERVVHGGVVSDHIVQLFDSRSSLAITVSAFLKEGLDSGDTVLAVMSVAHWHATVGSLSRSVANLDHLMRAGRITVRDAGATLSSFMRDGRVDRELFDESIGALIQELRSRGRHVRIYGEMVDILAAEGDFRGALQLETLWNELSEQESFTLFCGYSAVTFGDPTYSEALHRVCREHSQVRTNPRDALATFLVDSSRLHPTP